MKYSYSALTLRTYILYVLTIFFLDFTNIAIWPQSKQKLCIIKGNYILIYIYI